MLRAAILAAAASPRLRDLAAASPLSREVVRRYVAGDTEQDVITTTSSLAGSSLMVTVDRLGEDVTEVAQAERTVLDYVRLLDLLDDAGLTGRAEVSVKLTALGMALPGDGTRIALQHARMICQRAQEVGTTVTIDMEDHTTTDATLGIVADLRRDHPATGVVLQSYLHRTEGDVRDLATAGSRVRLCKGAYREPASVAHQERADIDRAYVRCLRILMESPAYPMVATHDPRLIHIAGSLAGLNGRRPGEFEFQMLHGVRPEEQRRLAAQGHRVRVYVPYGSDWWGYLMRRMAERPANLALFLRSLVSRA